MTDRLTLLVCIRPQLAVDFAAGDGGLEPVLDCGVIRGDRTAGDIQLTKRAVLDRDKVLLFKLAAADIQRAAQVVVTIADQRRTNHRAGGVRLPVAGVVGNNRLLDRHRADVADDVVGRFANRAIVVTLDRAGLGRGAVGNRGQCRSS